MRRSHSVKTWKSAFQDILDGKKTFDFRLNDRDYQLGDEVIHREFDPDTESEMDRMCFTTITYILRGPGFSIPDGYCIFGFHTSRQEDFVRDYDQLSNNILPRFEDKLSYRMSGTLMERVNHTLSEFNSIATNSVLQAKNFIEDVKTQFKALELIVEGITGHGNHTEKRVIANHVIHMLRSMVDRIDEINWDYPTRIFERYNYFRSQAPERTLMEKYRDMKHELERLKEQLKDKLPSEDLAF